MGKVKLTNMVFYGYHGVIQQEKELGGRFEVDVELDFDMSAAIHSDHLGDTISYEDVYSRVQEAVTGKKFHLLETLAGKVLRTLFQYFKIRAACVRVRKPSAPIKGLLDTVEIEVSRTREEMEQQL